MNGAHPHAARAAARYEFEHGEEGEGGEDAGLDDGQTMVPLLDMLQHASEPTVRHRKEGAAVVVRARRALAAGEELRTTYLAADAPAHTYFTRFGFVPGHEDVALREVAAERPARGARAARCAQRTRTDARPRTRARSGCRQRGRRAARGCVMRARVRTDGCRARWGADAASRPAEGKGRSECANLPHRCQSAARRLQGEPERSISSDSSREEAGPGARRGPSERCVCAHVRTHKQGIYRFFRSKTFFLRF